MAELFLLNDGRIVALGTAYNNSVNSQAIRIFNADGSEITSGPVFFATGTDYNDGFADFNDPIVLVSENGGIRIVLRDYGTLEGIEFELDASGNTTSSSTFTINNSDVATPYIAVTSAYVQGSDGDLYSASLQNLLRSDGDGTFIDQTQRPGAFESVDDSVVLQVGNRILRITQVDSSDGDVEIRGQYYNRDGTTSGNEFIVADDLEAIPGLWGVEAAVLSDGRIAVAYTSGRTGDDDDSGSTVFVTVLNANGTIAVAEQIVNTGDTTSDQTLGGVYALTEGGFAVAYGSRGSGFGTSDDSVNVRFYTSEGTEYEDYSLVGNNLGRLGTIHVSTSAIVTDMQLDSPVRLFEAGGPDDPGLTGDEQFLSQGFLGELAEDPDAAVLSDGRVVVVYDHTNLNGYIRIHDPEDGTTIDVGAPISDASEMHVTALADGGFAVAYITSVNRGDLFISVYEADGTVRSGPSRILDGEAEHINIQATATGFAVHWIDDTGTLDDDGYLQFYDAQGTALANPIEYHAGFDQDTPVAMTTLSDGRMVMLWTNTSGVAHYRIYNADGTPSSAVRDLPSYSGTIVDPVLIATDDGGFIAVYALGTDAITGTEVRMTTFDASGNSTISDRNVLVDDSVPNGYQNLTATINGDGQLLIAYDSYTDAASESDVRFSIFELSGEEVLVNQIGSENLEDDQIEPVLVALNNGDSFLVFEDDTNILFSSQNAIVGATIQGGTFPIAMPTPGPDILSGTDAVDDIDLLAGNDTYSGGDGDDIIFGNDGMDSLSGDDGNDHILGGNDADTLRGGLGDDTLDGGGSGDVLDGGDGYDIASYASADRSVRVDLQNPAISFNDAAGDTFISIEEFQTGDGIDQLRGDAGDNIFRTGGVSDRLYGRAGDDMLFGEAGADAFYGGLGADIMTGGDDAGRRDRYIYFNAAESGVGDGNRDVITDFVAGEDRIELSRIDADITQGFKQGFDFIGDAAFSGTGGELRYEQVGGNTIVQADRDGDGAADFEIELTGTMDLTESDFLI
ncbi:calcium-binding protein [Thalassococcus lentus]|uniref:Calcium-binding protein n=1 Tax=Thalassococcus lentus TaxID=1210524 RepID=A0ABT4XRU8_9RHOB|nr:calcium-binding protein [Thalassococcus lentus]MDA7424683.1 calcium-binding protein [Thalassococcus lentus]